MVLGLHIAAWISRDAPLSIVAIHSCGQFRGAVVTQRDGKLQFTQDQQRSEAIGNPLPDARRKRLEMNFNCGQKVY